jgi:hypothetical protein
MKAGGLLRVLGLARHDVRILEFVGVSLGSAGTRMGRGAMAHSLDAAAMQTQFAGRGSLCVGGCFEDSKTTVV